MPLAWKPVWRNSLTFFIISNMSVAAVKEDKTNFDTNFRLSERYSPNTSINADERMLPEQLSFHIISLRRIRVYLIQIGSRIMEVFCILLSLNRTRCTVKWKLFNFMAEVYMFFQIIYLQHKEMHGSVKLYASFPF